MEVAGRAEVHRGAEVALEIEDEEILEEEASAAAASMLVEAGAAIPISQDPVPGGGAHDIEVLRYGGF